MRQLVKGFLHLRSGFLAAPAQTVLHTAVLRFRFFQLAQPFQFGDAPFATRQSRARSASTLFPPADLAATGSMLRAGVCRGGPPCAVEAAILWRPGQITVSTVDDLSVMRLTTYSSSIHPRMTPAANAGSLATCS